MRTPGQRAYGGDAGSENRELKRQNGILSRRIADQQKVKPVAAGGGIVGITRVEAFDVGTVVEGSGTRTTIGQWRITPLAGTAPKVTGGAGNWFDVEPGYYTFTMTAWLNFDSAGAPGTALFGLDYRGSGGTAGGQLLSPVPVAPHGTLNDEPEAVIAWSVGPCPVIDDGAVYVWAEWRGADTLLGANYWIVDVTRWAS